MVGEGNDHVGSSTSKESGQVLHRVPLPADSGCSERTGRRCPASSGIGVPTGISGHRRMNRLSREVPGAPIRFSQPVCAWSLL